MQQAPPPTQLNIGPVPTNLEIGDQMIPTKDGMKKFLTFAFSTPQGMNVFFVNGDTANVERICDVIRAHASGLVLPVKP